MKSIFKFCTGRALPLALLLAVVSSQALATLGQAPSADLATAGSVSAASGPAAKALAGATASSLYTRHEVLLENGSTIAEYANPAGQVFALTWRGPVLPDLNALLGNYFKTFSQETDRLRQSGKRSASVAVNLDGLVLQSSGRMRNFQGFAYAPALIPAQLNIHDLLP
jgi:hypothetical protein